MSRILVVSDEIGTMLGYLNPAAESDPALYEWAQSLFTNEDIERARQEPGGLTLSELLNGLAEG